MRSLVAAILISASGLARADYFQDWEKRDSALLGSALGLLVADWGQSRYIAHRPAEYHEHNAFLSSEPSTREVDRYFTTVTLGTVAIAALLPPKPRRWFLGGIVAIEAVVVANNYAIGVRFDY